MVPYWESNLFTCCYRFITITWADQSYAQFYFQQCILHNTYYSLWEQMMMWRYGSQTMQTSRLSDQVQISYVTLPISSWFQHLLKFLQELKVNNCAEFFQKHSFHFGKIPETQPIQGFSECTQWLKTHSGVLLSGFKSQPSYITNCLTLKKKISKPQSSYQ